MNVAYEQENIDWSVEEEQSPEIPCEEKLGAVALCAACPLLRLLGDCPKALREEYDQPISYVNAEYGDVIEDTALLVDVRTTAPLVVLPDQFDDPIPSAPDKVVRVSEDKAVSQQPDRQASSPSLVLEETEQPHSYLSLLLDESVAVVVAAPRPVTRFVKKITPPPQPLPSQTVQPAVRVEDEARAWARVDEPVVLDTPSLEIPAALQPREPYIAPRPPVSACEQTPASSDVVIATPVSVEKVSMAQPVSSSIELERTLDLCSTISAPVVTYTSVDDLPDEVEAVKYTAQVPDLPVQEEGCPQEVSSTPVDEEYISPTPREVHEMLYTTVRTLDYASDGACQPIIEEPSDTQEYLHVAPRMVSRVLHYYLQQLGSLALYNSRVAYG